MKKLITGAAGSIALLLLASQPVAAQDAQSLTIHDPYGGTYDMFIGDTGPRFDASGRVTSSNGIINPPMVTVSFTRRSDGLYDVTRTELTRKKQPTMNGVGRLIRRANAPLAESHWALRGRDSHGFLAEAKLLVRWNAKSDALNGPQRQGMTQALTLGQVAKATANSDQDEPEMVGEYRLLDGRIEGELTTFSEDDWGSRCSNSEFEQGAKRGTHPEIIGSPLGEYRLRTRKASRTKIRLRIRPNTNLATSRLAAYEVLRQVADNRPEIGYGSMTHSPEGQVLVVRFLHVDQGGFRSRSIKLASYWLHGPTGRILGLEQLRSGGNAVRTAGWKDGSQLFFGKVIDSVKRNAVLLPRELMAGIQAALDEAISMAADAIVKLGDTLCVIGEAIETAAGHTIRFVLDSSGRVIELVVETADAVNRYVLQPMARVARKALAAGWEVVKDAATGTWKLIVRTAVGTYELAIRPVARAARDATVTAYTTWVSEVRKADGKLGD